MVPEGTVKVVPEGILPEESVVLLGLKDTVVAVLPKVAVSAEEVAKYEPETLTCAPTIPLVGLRLTEGDASCTASTIITQWAVAAVPKETVWPIGSRLPSCTRHYYLNC